MRYQKIESRIWNDEKFIQLTPLQQRLFLYILTCPHGNLIGVFVLKSGYVCEDLQVLPKDFQKDLLKIIEVGLVEYDEKVQVVWIKNFLRHNPITNPNQIKSARKTIIELPKSKIIQRFISQNEVLFEGLSEGLNEVLSKPEAEAETEAYTEAETETKEKREGADTDKPSRPRASKMSDEEWIETLKRNPAYQGINIEVLKAKMEAWCDLHGKKPTRARLLNWLNREEKPLEKVGKIQASRGVQGTLARIEELRRRKQEDVGQEALCTTT